MDAGQSPQPGLEDAVGPAFGQLLAPTAPTYRVRPDVPCPRLKIEQTQHCVRYPFSENAHGHASHVHASEAEMDLGIRGRTAIVCASSRGLGRACALALAEAGVSLVINGRDAGVLEKTARDIRQATGVDVTPVAADISTPEGQAAVLAACPQVDILVNNNGGPPLRDFRDLSREAMLAGLTMNMVTPIELIQKVIDSMAARGFGRIVNITSLSVKMPMVGLDLSSGARAGLTAFVAGVARTVADKNVTINNLLPGYFDTQRLRKGLAATANTGTSEEDIAAEWATEVPAKRFGSPAELGRTCAFLCSVHAGYITGQNILMDGGLFPSAF
jgi:3-oxoacyl-[acyl-carrier protein] reductase